MITLLNYLKTNIFDAHVHYFSHRGDILDKLDKSYDAYVGFMDVEFNQIDKYDKDSVIKYYSEFIRKLPKNHLLLATGTDSETMIELHKKFPEYISGFGECKCYGYYRENGEKFPLPFGNLDWIYGMCEYNRKFKLPVYIHYDMDCDERVNDFKKLLSKFPEIPFILCHFGIGREKQLQCYINTKNLLNIYPNLYTDISYTASEFFLQNPGLLKGLPQRLLIGTDVNMKGIEEGNLSKLYDNTKKIGQYINCNTAFIKLFKK